MGEGSADSALLDRILNEKLRVRQDLELMTGSDGTTLLYDPRSGSYMRLGKQMVKLLPAFDGRRSGTEIVLELSDRWEVPRDTLRLRLGATLKDLAEAGVFEGYEPPPESNRAHLAARAGRLAMGRFPLLSESAVKRLVHPALAILRPLPPGLPSFVAGSCALLGLALCVFTIGRLGVPMMFGLPAVLAVAAVLVQTVFHELSHALVCHRYGVTVRSLGVALWYWFIPVAYVDRTDAYRLVRRRPRFMISVAGPGADMIVAGVAAVLVWRADGLLANTAYVFVFLELVLLVVNLNPLLPTDGQQVLEGLTGEINLRNRAMRYLGHIVLRASLPSYLIGLSLRRRVIYIAYGTLSVLYLVAVAVYLLGSFLGFTRIPYGPVG